MDMVSFNGVMGDHTKDIGKTVSKTELVFSQLLKMLLKKGNGKTVKN
jgi:hypothetical protein